MFTQFNAFTMFFNALFGRADSKEGADGLEAHADIRVLRNY